MNEHNDIQLIEDYLDGQLKGKELEAFQKKLETDDEFAKEYKLRLKLAGLWKDADEYQQAKKQVREVMDLEKRSIFYRYRKSYYLIAVAASIVLLFGIYWLFVRTDNGKQVHENQMTKVADTALLHRDIPEKLAKIEYNIQLTTPANKQQYTSEDTLVFHWTAPLDTTKIGFGILDNATHQIVFHSRVSLSDTLFILYPGLLPAGKYAWYLQDTLNMNYFTIK